MLSSRGSSRPRDRTCVSLVSCTGTQHLVLFLGGKSQDDISRYSQVIKSAGIASLGVGDRNIDRTELQTITSDPRLVFTVREFRDLPNIEERIVNSFGSSGVTPAPPGVDTPSPSRPGMYLGPGATKWLLYYFYSVLIEG